MAACKARRPFRTIRQMADAAGCKPVTLTHEWSQVTNPSDPRLVEALGALALLDAAAFRRATRSWEAVARELRVSVDTLRRRARVCLGLTLHQLAALDPEEVLQRLRRRVLDRVILGPDWKELP